jgi:hypothetical protein
MAPEQILGREGSYGPETDVWALGVLLYQVLTDLVPFPGTTMVALIAQVVTSPPQPPRHVDPSVTEAIQAVCLKALNKTPADRFPNGNAFAVALDAARRGVVPAAAKRTRMRIQWRAAAVGLLIATFLATVGITLAVLETRYVETRPSKPKRASGSTPLSARLDTVLAAAGEDTPYKTALALEQVASELRQRPDVVGRLDAIRRARTRRAQGLATGSHALSLELELLGVLARCRAPEVPDDDVELATAQEALLESVLVLLDKNMWSDTRSAEAGTMTLTALATSEIRLSDGGLAAGVRLSDSYLTGVRFNTIGSSVYLDGLVALARLDVRLEQSHLLVYLMGGKLSGSRAWLGSPSSDPVRRALQALIQTRVTDKRQAQKTLNEILSRPTPSWGPRLRARVLGFASQDPRRRDLAVSRLEEARRLDPHSPYLLGALAKTHLSARRHALALEPAEQALAMHYAQGHDDRIGNRWETPWLHASIIEILTGLERYEEAGAMLDDVFMGTVTGSTALEHLKRFGVLAKLEQELGRSFGTGRR